MNPINLTLTNLQQWKNEIVNEMAIEISKQFASLNLKPQNPMMISSQVKKMLNCSSSKLETLMKSGVLPYTKVIGTLYFKKSDVEKFFFS